MELNLDGKHVFIAGASQGIGIGVAEAYLKEGAKVTITARGADKLREQGARLTDAFGEQCVATYAGDMTQTDQIEQALSHGESQLGPVDIAIANVGIAGSPPGYAISDDDWAKGLNQNLNSGYRLARAVLPRFEKKGTGNLILISSIAGGTALGTSIDYGTSKAAINHLTRELARHVGRQGIRVNAVSPGNIKFPGGGWEKRVKERPEAWGRWIKREVPLARFGETHEIADACLWLSSDRASFVTGAVIPVDGGQSRA